MQELKLDCLSKGQVSLDVHNQINHLLAEAEKIAMRDTVKIDDEDKKTEFKFIDEKALNNWLSNLTK